MAGIPMSTQLFLTGIFSFLLYGIYVMVFGTCVYVLRQKANRKKRVHLVSIIILFSLATFALACSAAQICLELSLFQLPGDVPNVDEGGLFDLIYREFIFNTCIEAAQLLATLVAEAILIYRCYVLWNNKKVVIVIPIILSIVETGLLLSDMILVSIEDFPTKPLSSDETPINLLIAFTCVCTTTNLSLSCLIGKLHSPLEVESEVDVTPIGGRILYLSNSSRSVFGDGLDKKYKKIVAVILESGALYSAFLITYLALVVSETGLRSGSQVLQPSVIQITGLAPTLIIVRSGLRVSIGNNSQSDTLASSGKGLPSSQTDVSKDQLANMKPPTFELKRLHYEQTSSETTKSLA
ncbi:hypothetical protein VKT23_009980 [Stygiomarasmius scandens]|uniref:Uncharacterized protein n=1 Tax=Marasmiellus scandens TaxID=2682957 RepID=A0ABR1JDC7_9AGAR